jgi:hypothetical protein
MLKWNTEMKNEEWEMINEEVRRKKQVNRVDGVDMVDGG